jgi:hypothetical protein
VLTFVAFWYLLPPTGPLTFGDAYPQNSADAEEAASVDWSARVFDELLES